MFPAATSIAAGVCHVLGPPPLEQVLAYIEEVQADEGKWFR